MVWRWWSTVFVYSRVRVVVAYSHGDEKLMTTLRTAGSNNDNCPRGLYNLFRSLIVRVRTRRNVHNDCFPYAGTKEIIIIIVFPSVSAPWDSSTRFRIEWFSFFSRSRRSGTITRQLCVRFCDFSFSKNIFIERRMYLLSRNRLTNSNCRRPIDDRKKKKCFNVLEKLKK